ncbi:hypothetical protein Tco_0110083 [Tanacetum coccineum]
MMGRVGPQPYLLKFTSEYGIPEGLHPELPGPEETIVEFSEGKVGVYTKFFEFANFRIPISQFLFDILGHQVLFWSLQNFRIPLYPQFSLISPMSITANSLFVTIVKLIGWISFSNKTRPGKTHPPQCSYNTPRTQLILRTGTIDFSRAEHGEILSGSVDCPQIHKVMTETVRAAMNGNPILNVLNVCDRKWRMLDRRARGGNSKDRVRDEVAYEIPPTGNASTTGVALETGLEEAGSQMQAPDTKCCGWIERPIPLGLVVRSLDGRGRGDLADIEAYDPEANSKLVKALQDLKDLKYPMVDQLEMLKDAPIELIMASLHLENPWVVKEEMLLEDAIAANISQAEKKKKCRVVCRTHGIGFAHHARSEGLPLSAPTVVPQGLAILLADAATQTEAADKEEEPHSRLQRSISLPPVNNL